VGQDVYYDPYDYAIDEHPHPVWKQMRDEAPVYYNDKYDFYALSRFDDVRSASMNWQTFRSGRGSVLELIRNPEMLELVRTILFMDPVEHDQLRSLVNRVFTPRRVALLESRIRELCAEYLDPFVGSGGFDYVQDFGAKLPMMVIGSMLGIPIEDQDDIRSFSDAMLHREEGETDQDFTSTMALMQYFASAATLRRHHPRDDLMSDLVHAELTLEDGTTRPLDEGELMRFLNILSAAGNETVARLLSWAGATLARHPDQRRELVADPSLIPNCIEELLRYEAPSPVQARWVETDAEYHGTTIPAGSVALLLTGSAGHDERVYPDPERFDIHRTFEQQLSFGVGIHFCLGAALARLETRVALEETFKRFPTWDVDLDTAEMVRTSTVRGYHRLPITV
jgi:cytochrome P450